MPDRRGVPRVSPTIRRAAELLPVVRNNACDWNKDGVCGYPQADLPPFRNKAGNCVADDKGGVLSCMTTIDASHGKHWI